MAAAVGAALFTLTRSSLETIDTQAKIATQIGGTTAAVQTLAHAGNLAGVSISEMEGNLQRMNRRLGEFASTGAGPAGAAFDRLGLAADDLLDLDVDDRVALIADAMQGLESEAEMAAIAFNIFGEAGLRMVPLLLQGGDAIRGAREELDRFGVTVTEAGAQRVEAANDAVTTLGLAFTGLGNTLAIRVAPALESAAEWLGNYLSENDRLIESVLEIVQVLGTVLAGILVGRLLSGIVGAVTAIGTLVTAIRLASVSAISLQVAMGPLGLALGVVSAIVILLANRQEEAGAATKIHAETIDILMGRIVAATDQAPEYIQSLEDEARAALDAAQANLALAEARAANLQALVNEPRIGPAAANALEEELTNIEAIRDNIFAAMNAILAARSRSVTTNHTAESGGAVPFGPALDPGQAEVGVGDEDALNKALLHRKEIIQASLSEIASLTQESVDTIDGINDSGYQDELDAAREQQRSLTEIEEAGNAERARNRMAVISQWGSVMGQLSNLIKNEGEKQFKIAKGLAIAEALINVAQGITKALAGPFPFLNAAAIAASGAIQIASIRRQQSSGGGSVTTPSGGGVGSGGGGGGGSQTLHVEGIDESALFSGSAVRGLAERLLEYQADGGKVVFQ